MNIDTSRARTRFVVAGTVLILFSAAGFDGSGVSSVKAKKAWAAYTQAERQYQEESADFLAARQTDLKELIFLNRNLQLALIERRSLEFQYLLVEHPERIVTNRRISRFANYDWTDEDAQALRRTNPAYVAAIDHLKDLKERSDRDSRWPALRAASQALAKEPDYQDIDHRFKQRTETAGRLLK